jgi:hypothetical protein
MPGFLSLRIKLKELIACKRIARSTLSIIITFLLATASIVAEAESTSSSNGQTDQWGNNANQSLAILTQEYQDILPKDQVDHFRMLLKEHSRTDALAVVHKRLEWLQTILECKSAFAAGGNPRFQPDEVLASAQDAFDNDLSDSNLTLSERLIAKHFYEACSAACEKKLQAFDSKMATRSAEIRLRLDEYVLIPTLLEHTDPLWSQLDFVALPDWVRADAGACAGLEEFALSAARPDAAYWFYCSACSQREKPVSISAYLLQHSARMSLIKGRGAAAACLKLAVDQATDPADIIASRIRLAELLSEMKRHDEAADIVLGLMRVLPKDDDFAKWTVTYLKYLYSSGNDTRLLKEIKGWEGDSRCAACQAELLFINWASTKRLNNTSDAGALKDQFFKNYPDHPLGADIIFGSAMDALEAGDSPNADQLLESIETHYPRWKHIKEVQALREKLRRP